MPDDAPTGQPADSTTGGPDGSTGTTGTPPETGAVDWEGKYREQLKHNRTWEGRAKDNAAASETLAAVAKALGLDKPDADTLTAKITDAQQQARTWQDSAGAAQVENIVLRTAYRLGANADRILDSRTMCDEIDDLEPENAADFAKQVEAKITAWIGKDPTLKTVASRGPARLGAEHTGSGGSGGLDEQIAAAEQSGRWQDVIALKRRKAGLT